MAFNNLQSRLSLLLLLVHFLLLVMPFVALSHQSDSKFLLNFRKSLHDHKHALSGWNSSTTPCSGNKHNWVGVLCDKGNVWGLKLENMGLSGLIDIDSISSLASLRSISLMNNNFSGDLPELRRLGRLKSVFLSNNKFSGEIGANMFDGMMSLKKVHLANNKFTGLIPLSLTILPKLIELRLEGNEFEGHIPDFKVGVLRSANLSNNKLEGPIPPGLSKMTADSFSGNVNLCGAPLASCASPKKLPIPTIVVLVIVLVVAIGAIAAVFIILQRRCQTTSNQTEVILEAPPMAGGRAHKREASVELDKVEVASQHSTSGSKKAEINSGKLIFLSNGSDDKEVAMFDLSDLLKASAEVLGSGYFGASYKAALMNGKEMVVKRFKYLNNVNREEFQEHMRRLGRLKHPNLLPLIAFYYRKEEKLIVTEFVRNVSLAVQLHGNSSRGRPSLNWATRLKIIKGVARALEYLYNELPSLITPHGHLKSSNVLLNESFEPLLADYGLVPVVNQEHAQQIMVSYKSPEFKQNGRITKKTDVWSFGVLILETLTGKFPANCLHQGKTSDGDLVTWVNSVVHEERIGELLFDKDMGGAAATKEAEGEMMKLLKIGLACAETDVEKRSDLKEAIERIRELKDKDDDGM